RRGDIPGALVQLVMQCLEKDPSRRPQRTAEVLERLDASVPPVTAAGASAPTAEKSLVVLPFENLSPDPDNAFFADGLTDELIAELSQVHALRVISRTSAR